MNLLSFSLIFFKRQHLFCTLENLLDNLLFFNQESTNNAVSDAVSTAGATIGTADSLLGLGDGSEFTRTKSLDL